MEGWGCGGVCLGLLLQAALSACSCQNTLSGCRANTLTDDEHFKQAEVAREFTASFCAFLHLFAISPRTRCSLQWVWVRGCCSDGDMDNERKKRNDALH